MSDRLRPSDLSAAISEVSRHDFPDVWVREARGGYGYVERVPCRVLTQTAERTKILVPKESGETVVRYVRRENIRRDARVF